MEVALEALDLLFKISICAFMAVTISRERDHYRYLKELHEELNERQSERQQPSYHSDRRL